MHRPKLGKALSISLQQILVVAFSSQDFSIQQIWHLYRIPVARPEKNTKKTGSLHSTGQSPGPTAFVLRHAHSHFGRSSGRTGTRADAFQKQPALTGWLNDLMLP